MPQYTQDNRPISILTPLGKDVLLLVGFRGREGISQLFNFQLDLLAENGTAIPFDKLLGQKVTITVTLPNGKPHYINGICNRVSEGEQDTNFTAYHMELVPQVWLLTRKAQSRIFQQMTVPDMLKKVLQGLDVAYEIQGTFHPRDYCVQYRETDFNFASRIMEEEGIYYFFKQNATGHQLVLANTPQSHPDLPEGSDLIYENVLGGTRDEERIYDWEKFQELRSGKYTLWDHSFELPHKHLEVDRTIPESVQVGKVTHKFQVGNSNQLEIYDYPGEYAQRFDGVTPGGGDRAGDLQKIFEDNKRTVAIRMQQEALPAIEIRGGSNCRHLVSGYKFTLQRHFNADGQYVLTTVSHSAHISGDYRSAQGGQFDYYNAFTCIPLTLPYRPLRTTPKPFVQGTQTAVVVGPSGEEIFTDKYGRVKVQFHWDREGKQDENSSCWTRVAQAWAGKRWGTMFLPRIGQEVIVAFQEGDPDQPIIVGSVYNAEQMPAYLGNGPDGKHRHDPRLSGVKSNSTKGGQGFNELRFDDTKGKEQVFIHAQRNMDVRVRASSMESVGGDRHLTVGGERDGQKTGDYRQKVFRDKETIVGQDVKTEVKRDYYLQVDGDYIHFTTKKHYSMADEGYYFLTNKGMVLEAFSEICLKCGPSFIKLTPAGIWINGPLVNINSGGAPSIEEPTLMLLPTDPAGADTAVSGSPSNSASNSNSRTTPDDE